MRETMYYNDSYRVYIINTKSYLKILHMVYEIKTDVI